MKSGRKSKKYAVLMAGLLMFACGCGNTQPAGGVSAPTEAVKEIPTIQISLWGDERYIPILEEAMQAFQAEHADEVVIDYRISKEGEDTCKETVLADPEGAADIFTFADDQMEELWKAGALLQITQGEEQVLASVGGYDSAAAKAAMRDGKLYAYPLSAGNGYFLYYNDAYFSGSDVLSLDRILEVAEENGKKFSMDFGSGWYIYSFFKGAGLDMTAAEDGSANLCNWNATDTEYTGVDVAETMLALAGREGFINQSDDGFVAGVESGEVIAGINGAWNAGKVEAAWGEHYAATKLPACTIAGDQVQMCSFVGYKMTGINAHTKYPEWCMRIAEYLTGEEYQLKRFEAVGECPAALNAAAEEEVQAAPAVAALGQQAEFGYAQNVLQPFWDASARFGVMMAGGNPDGKDLQKVLDDMVQQITAPVE
ncbi:MAG: extracellular solute-binding protein [Lachnospiraceae bacterium]|nr:extracellular solute-binding protein [Lachnospiraceae bacterium]